MSDTHHPHPASAGELPRSVPRQVPTVEGQWITPCSSYRPIGQGICGNCGHHCDAHTQTIPVQPKLEAVDHPQHYGGADNPYEAIKVIEAWGLGFNLGNAAKYISRAGKKDSAKKKEDLNKAAWYLNREIENLP